MMSSILVLPVLVWSDLRSLQEIIVAFTVEYPRIPLEILA